MPAFERSHSVSYLSHAACILHLIYKYFTLWKIKMPHLLLQCDFEAKRSPTGATVWMKSRLLSPVSSESSPWQLMTSTPWLTPCDVAESKGKVCTRCLKGQRSQRFLDAAVAGVFLGLTASQMSRVACVTLVSYQMAAGPCLPNSTARQLRGNDVFWDISYKNLYLLNEKWLL